MLKNKKKRISKDGIAIGLAILLAIVLYGQYIATPFGDYDTWFERIAFGGYDFKDLPEPLQKLQIPTSLNEYRQYRERVVGRLFGSVLPTYALTSLFGERVLGWRIVLYLVMFATFWLLYAIMRRLRLPYWHRLFSLLFFVILLNRYFIKPISIIIGLSHLFFLIALALELGNSGRKAFKWRYSVFGALAVFLSLFIRELSATSVPALLVVLLFWHAEEEGIALKFRWDWRRLAPYAAVAALYSALYLRMSLGKSDYAYSNMISWKVDLSYVKEVFLLLIKWIGVDSSLYLGVFIAGLAGITFLVVVAKAGYLPQKTDGFTLLFGLLLLLPTLLLIPFLKHGTGSFTLQYLACMIVISFLIAYMDNAALSRRFKKTGHVILSAVFVVLWIVYALEALQKAEDYCADAVVTAAAVKWTAQELPQAGALELAGFHVTSAYSFVADMYISGRDDRITYRLRTAGKEGSAENYMVYLRSGFTRAGSGGEKMDLRVNKKWRGIDSDSSPDREQTGVKVKLLRRPLKRYSLGYLLIGRSNARGGNGAPHAYGACATFLAKFFFAVRPRTLETQRPGWIEYRIGRPQINEVLQP